MALVFENNVPSSYRKEFVAKVIDISKKIGINPNWLMAIISWESANSFSASKKNQIGCTGLIQFCPDRKGVNYKTINGKRYYLSDLAKMTAVQQLDVVYEYFKSYTNKLKSYTDTYFAVFFPLAIGKPDDFILQGGGLSPLDIYEDNPGFRIQKDGKIRVWEVKQVMLKKLPSEWLNDGSFSLAVKAYKTPISIAIGVPIIIYLSYKIYGKYFRTA